MMYSVEYKRSSIKELQQLNKKIQLLIVDEIDKLKIQPRPSGVTKILGKNDMWRIRIGDYRVVYRIYDNKLQIMIIRISHRKDVYYNLPD